MQQRCREYAKGMLSSEAWDHCARMRKLTRRIASEEGMHSDDLKAIEFVVIFHSLHSTKEGEQPDEAAHEARNVLISLDADMKLINAVVESIQTGLLNSKRKPSTNAAKALLDAECLELIGALGTVGLLEEAHGKSVMQRMEHVREKSESAYSSLNTEASKRIAQKYYETQQKFLKEWDEQINEYNEIEEEE